MAGVTSPLPADLHAWDPITLATSARALTAPLTATTAAGTAHRTGHAAALTLPLAAGAGLGVHRVARPGGPVTLPLAAGPGDGLVFMYVGAPGDAITLPFSQASGLGIKRARGQGSSLVSLLVSEQGSGRARKQASGQGAVIAVSAPLAAGRKQAQAGAPPVPLGVSCGRGAGRHFELVFLGPVDQDWRPMDLVQRGLLYYGIPYGKTVWRDAQGTWHAERGPNPHKLVGADPVYSGGRVHFLSVEARDELIAAGYGDNIALQEVR